MVGSNLNQKENTVINFVHKYKRNFLKFYAYFIISIQSVPQFITIGRSSCKLKEAVFRNEKSNCGNARKNLTAFT